MDAVFTPWKSGSRTVSIVRGSTRLFYFPKRTHELNGPQNPWPSGRAPGFSSAPRQLGFSLSLSLSAFEGSVACELFLRGVQVLSHLCHLHVRSLWSHRPHFHHLLRVASLVFLQGSRLPHPSCPHPPAPPHSVPISGSK